MEAGPHQHVAPPERLAGRNGRHRQGTPRLSLALRGDTDEHGYDHANEIACLWIYLRVGLDRGELDEDDPSEWIDLQSFGLRFWPMGR